MPLFLCGKGPLRGPGSEGAEGSQGSGGGGGRLKIYSRRQYDKTFTTALAGEGKQANCPVGDKNAPLLVLTHHLSPGGETFPAAKQ